MLNNNYHERENKKKIVVIIPVLNEVKEIENCIRYFLKIKKKVDIEIVISTTNRENLPQKNLTLLKARKYQKNGIKIINYPFSDGNKASQINYCVDKIRREYDYIGVFDVDSRPSLKSFEYIINDKESCEVYQITPYYKATNKKNNFQLIASLNQNNWVRRFEIPNLIDNYYKNKNKIMYCVGHGLIIRKKLIKEVPFPENTNTEDLMWGYAINNSKIYPKPVPYFDESKIALNLKDQISQTSRWYSGELDSLFKLYGKKLFKNLKVLERIIFLILWILGPWIIIFLANTRK